MQLSQTKLERRLDEAAHSQPPLFWIDRWKGEMVAGVEALVRGQDVIRETCEWHLRVERIGLANDGGDHVSARSGPRRAIPTRSTNRRNCALAGSRGARGARTMCARCA